MKRFLVFCAIIVVVVALGYTCVFFLTDNEKINISNSLYQINKGETRTLEYEHLKPKSSTRITYEISDEGIIEFDEETKQFTAIGGGATTIRIKSSNENIEDILVEVNVGDGSYDYPYFIRSASDLATIGTQTSSAENIAPFRVEDSYILTGNIEMGATWTPISGTFTGTLFGEGYTISGMNITGEGNNAGLFESIGPEGGVQYVNFSNASIDGSFANAGVVAGTNYGNIHNVHIIASSINNTNASGFTGGVVGFNSAFDVVASSIYKSSVQANITGSGNVGGIVAVNNGGYVYNCYTKESTTVTGQSASGIVGGLVAVNQEKDSINSIIRDCYSLATVASANDNLGAIVGKHNYDDTKNPKVINLVVGCYYLENDELVGVHGYQDLSATINQHDQFAFGVMGVEGKSLNELRTQSTFISHISVVTGNSVAWDFNEAWKLENNSTPSINADGANIKLSIATLNIGGSNLLQAADLSNLSMDGTYYVQRDIDLGGMEWTPLGSPMNGFRGLLSGVWLEEEQRYTKIYNFKLTDGGNVGFFNTISGGEVANLVFADVTTEDQNTGNDIVNFGIVAGVNNGGYIHDITISGTNSNLVNAIDKTAYIGGVVGTNANSVESNGVITKCTVDVGLLKNFVNNYNVPTYIGGIAGQNFATVSHCGVAGGEIVRNSTFTGAAGGIVGLNKKDGAGAANVTSNYVTNTVILTNYSYSGGNSDSAVFNGHYAGGIVGDHQGVNVNYNLFDGEVNGFAVGGVVGYARGLVEQNQTTDNALMKGCLVGGIAAYQQGRKGETDLRNNRIEGTLFGVDFSGNVANIFVGNETTKAGLVVGSGKLGGGQITQAYNNFVSVHFGGKGINRLDNYCPVTEVALERYNNIFNKSTMTNLYEHWFNDTFIHWFWTLSHKFSEKVITENEILSTNFKAFKDMQFSDAIWNLDSTINEGFPTLFNVVSLPQDDEEESLI